MKKTIIIITFLLAIFGCNRPLDSTFEGEKPIFNSDSAYLYIEKQVQFGPRIPNTEAHELCGTYLSEKLEEFGALVINQMTVVEKYNGEKLKIKNIIGEFYPEKENRIFLFAHWDTRPYSDYDPDSVKQYLAFDSANDGTSGVGVLLEIARQISEVEPNIGVDIIFFDAEDQGEHKNEEIYNETSWCLGSQFWANNLHKENYNPYYGIAVDMVGAKDAKFSKEDNSRHFAGYVTKRVWEIAENLGYSKYFISDLTSPILHDHLFVSKIAGFRTLIIIDYSEKNPLGYNIHWHTQNDNMSIIDKKTLEAVGKTLIEVIYSES